MAKKGGKKKDATGVEMMGPDAAKIALFDEIVEANRRADDAKKVYDTAHQAELTAKNDWKALVDDLQELIRRAAADDAVENYQKGLFSSGGESDDGSPEEEGREDGEVFPDED